MNIRNPFHVGAFVLLTSIALWLTLAVAQGFFLTSVPQAADYCKKWVRIPDDVDAPERLAGSSYRCVEFTSSLERLKYYHNLRMVKRNRVLLYVVMATGFVVSLGVFYALPKWRRARYAHDHNPLGGTLVLGFLLAFSPMMLGKVLPSPSRWAPDAMKRYFESRRVEALIELGELAMELDIQGRNGR